MRLDGDNLGNDDCRQAGQETLNERNNARVTSSRRYTSSYRCYGDRSGVSSSQLLSQYSRTCHNARYCHRLAVLTVHQQDRTRLCSRRGYRLGYYICRDAAIGRDRQVPAHLVMRMLIIQCRMMWLLTPDLAARQEPVVDQLQ
jgi:hypothetical protein